jgi:phosphatidylglycerophosphatase A
MNRLAVAAATVGGVGFAPVAPGTAGSAVGVAIFLLAFPQSPVAVLATLLAVTVLAMWASDRAASHFGRRDPGVVVIDEVAGQLVALAFTGAGLRGALAGFVLFRVFDVVKPWPVNRLERLPGGTGIVADDLMAGAYVNVILQAALRLAPGLS